MYCFTLNVGGQPSRGLHVKADNQSAGVFIGGDTGITLPTSKELFETMVRLDEQALQLPHLKDITNLPLPLVYNANLVDRATLEGTEPAPEDEDVERPVLVGRSSDDPDRRALVHVLPPEGVHVRYSGCYKREQFTGTKVIRGYPSILEVEGIEVLAECNGEVLLIMQPNASFRVSLPRHHEPNFHMYRLTMAKRPRLVPTTPTTRREAA